MLLNLKQSIESLEKFFLGTVLEGKELDVVDEQCAGGPVMLFDRFDVIAAQRLDLLTDEVFRM